MINLVDILDESARAHPDKVAVRFKGRSFTYACVKDRVDRLAGALASRGVEKGDHIAVISPNSSTCIELVFACARLGAVCEQYNIRLSALNTARLLAQSEAEIVFFAPAAYAAMRECLGEVGRPLQVVLLEQGAFGDDAVLFEDMIAEAEPRLRTADVTASDDAVMLYTSGTTGLPRGVLLSHGALLTRIEIDAREQRFVHDDVLLCVLPLFHVTSVCVYVTLFVGGELVIAESRKAPDIVADIERYGITRTGLVPFIMRGLVDYVEESAGAVDLGGLRYIVYGGEPVSPVLLKRCRRYLGCGLMQGYGMTETASAIAMLTPEQHGDDRLLSTVGKAVGGMELKVVGESGSPCPNGTPGEVAVRTKTLMTGYYRDDERTAEVVRDGWYLTGDIGFLDDEGYLSVIDRKSNMIISGGENVYPIEVADCIRNMGDAVLDVAVVGIPDEHWGESLAAFVVRAEDSPLEAADVVAHCARELGGYKKPSKVLFVDDLARNASGKIPKAHMEDLKRQLLKQQRD